MKKIILKTILAGLFIFGIAFAFGQQSEKLDKSYYKVIQIESCQYLKISYGQYCECTYFIHKGDCNNPIHKIK